MKKVAIIMGSDSDLPVVSKAADTLKEFGVPYEVHIFSAHRTPVEARDFTVNARENGSLKTQEDYQSRLQYMIDNLGYEKMKHFHVHFSKIEYTQKGEVRHLTFEDEIYGPDFAPLSKALKKLGLEPFIICESAGTQSDDALAMKNYYMEIQK